MATRGSAAALYVSDTIGTLAPGMNADCVLLDADPATDVEALRHVALVVKDGRVVYRSPSLASTRSLLELCVP